MRKGHLILIKQYYIITTNPVSMSKFISHFLYFFVLLWGFPGAACILQKKKKKSHYVTLKLPCKVMKITIKVK